MASVASTFKTHEPSLPELLDEIHKGTIQLPDFQRGWVWDDDRIRALIASVSLSYPIGAVLLMETGDHGLRFKPRLVEGAPPANGTKPETLIPDGQQRLTSWGQVALGVTPPGRPGPCINRKPDLTTCTMKHAQQIADHESPKTTKLYDRATRSTSTKSSQSGFDVIRPKRKPGAPH